MQPFHALSGKSAVDPAVEVGADHPRRVVVDLPDGLPVVPGEAEAVLRAIVDELDWILKGR